MAGPAVIRPSTLDPFFLSLDTLYQRGYMAGQSTYEQWAMTVPSSSKQTVHGWLDKMPKLREWIGPRDVQNLVAQSYTLTNKKFELTFAVKREDMEDDVLNLYGPATEMMGMQAREWPDDLMTPILENGDSTTTFDGANFFSASHPTDTSVSGSTLQSNLLTTATSAAHPLTPANAADVRSIMRKFKGRDGKPLGMNMTAMIVPPALEHKALQIANSEFIVASDGVNASTGGATNILRGTFKVIVNPKLTSDTAWYAIDDRFPIRPFIFQLRQAPEFTYLTNPTDSNVFNLDEYRYGVRARGVGGYGLWFMAVKCDV